MDSSKLTPEERVNLAVEMSSLTLEIFLTYILDTNSKVSKRKAIELARERLRRIEHLR